jgi:hypothetical protein
VVSAAGGPKIAGGEQTAWRLMPAIHLISEQYAPPADSTEAAQMGSGPLRPRQIRALGAEIGYLRERYSQRSGINSLERREDFNLGTELRLRLGYSPAGLGAHRDGLFFILAGNQGLPLGPRRFAIGRMSAVGEVVGEGAQDIRARSSLHYYENLSPRHTLAMRLRADYGYRLAPQAVFTLGARTGMRGFEAYRFWGDRVMLLNIEDRLLLLRDFAGLLTLGSVAFLDAGVAWRAGCRDRARPRVAAGLGIRLQGTRSRGSLITRVDLGYPLLGGSGEDGVVISVAAGQAF